MAKNRKTTNKKGNNSQTRKEVLNNISDNSIGNIIKCIVIVLAIFGVMYLVTLLILKKSSLDYITKEKESTSIQYSEILAGTSFSKNNDEYLVLFYDLDSDDASIYEGLYSDYKAKDEHLPIYYVDLSSALNKGVISDNSNKDASNAEELKIHGTTLIRFKDHRIEDYFESEEEIKNYFNS